MPRKSQLVELLFRDGVITNESPLAIGQRLRVAQNVAWDYRYPRRLGSGVTGPWMTRQPLTFPSVPLSAFTTTESAKSFRDIAFTANGALPVVGNGVLLIGCNGLDQYAAWSTDGIALPFTGTRFTLSDASRMPGCSVWWATPGTDPNGGATLSEGLTVFSHLSGSHVYYLLDSGATIRSLTTDVTNCPAGAAALAVHLDRLWLLEGAFLYFTDPLNADSIRTTSVISVRGSGRCLIPGQLGTIDATGVPHLVIGTTTGVQIFDGDPSLGNATLRTVAEGVGILNAHAGAITPYGVYYIGSDADLYHLPLGMQEVRSVGALFRDRIGINNVTNALDTERGSLVWFNPYLYLFPGGETAHAYVLEPTREGLGKVWGPVTLTSSISTRPAVIRAPTDNLALHTASFEVPSVHSIDSTPVASEARYMMFHQRTDPASSGRTSLITTGLLNVPGHRVQVTRVILETLRLPQVSAADVQWSVTVTDERGNTATGRRHPESIPAAGTYSPTAIATQHFACEALPASRGVSITISTTTSADLGLIRAYAEVHQTPAQF